MKALLFKTDENLSPLFLRVFLSLVIFPHGAQKLTGWFHGFGFNGSMKYFTDTVGLPAPVGLLVIIIEFFGPLALLAGFATRLWGIALATVMAGIIITNFSSYYFMNWFGNQPTEGMEFFLLAIGMAVSLAWSGAGRLSVDSLIYRRLLSPRLRKSGYQTAV